MEKDLKFELSSEAKVEILQDFIDVACDFGTFLAHLGEHMTQLQNIVDKIETEQTQHGLGLLVDMLHDGLTQWGQRITSVGLITGYMDEEEIRARIMEDEEINEEERQHMLDMLDSNRNSEN